MIFRACGRTDKGLTRPNNEDRYCIAENPTLFIVADGMGGHAAGEIASQIAIDATLDQIKKADSPPEQFVGEYNKNISDAANRLASAVRLANQVIYKTAQDNKAWRGMGTTITVVWPVANDKIAIAHVGDSRIYLIRDNKIKRLTRDHSIIEEQIDQGLITEKQVPNSGVKNIITRCLGYESQVQVDVNELELENDDKLLLCSDGLTNMVSDEEILDILNTKEKLATICDKLIETANRKGGKDNITVVLAHCQKD